MSYCVEKRIYSIVSNSKEYYEFIRILRNDPKNQAGFLEKVAITKEQQESYMSAHADKFFICLFNNTPVGYIGVIDNDIRICTEHSNKNLGAGEAMLSYIKEHIPTASGRILKDNTKSIKLFQKVGVPFILLDK